MIKKSNPKKATLEVEVTEREKELVSLLCTGKNAVWVSMQAGVNQTKLATELAIIRAKYDCNNGTQLVAYFLRNKLIN